MFFQNNQIGRSGKMRIFRATFWCLTGIMCSTEFSKYLNNSSMMISLNSGELTFAHTSKWIGSRYSKITKLFP